jgi:hypothetical protein
MLLPSGLRRLYIARDADVPRLGDFNEDLHVFGLETLRAARRLQLVPKDVARFLHSSTVAAE